MQFKREDLLNVDQLEQLIGTPLPNARANAYGGGCGKIVPCVLNCSQCVCVCVGSPSLRLEGIKLKDGNYFCSQNGRVSIIAFQNVLLIYISRKCK